MLWCDSVSVYVPMKTLMTTRLTRPPIASPLSTLPLSVFGYDKNDDNAKDNGTTSISSSSSNNNIPTCTTAASSIVWSDVPMPTDPVDGAALLDRAMPIVFFADTPGMV